MSETKRKNYPASFKAKIGLEAIRGVKTENEIGQEHGVHPTQVEQWKKEILENSRTLFEPDHWRKPTDDPVDPMDPERLYSEIGRLKMELEWLKNMSRLSLLLRPTLI